MDNTDEIFTSRWLRVRWNEAVAFGFGIDPQSCVIGFYIGPISVFLGDNSDGSDDD